MREITPLAQPLTRSQFYAFGEAYTLPSGMQPHLYTRYFETGYAPNKHDVSLDIIVTGLMNISDTVPNMGIRGYINDLTTGPELRYRLDCEPDGNVEELENWIIDIFNGVVEQIDSMYHLTPENVDEAFLNWGIDLEGFFC